MQITPKMMQIIGFVTVRILSNYLDKRQLSRETRIFGECLLFEWYYSCNLIGWHLFVSVIYGNLSLEKA